MLNFKDYFQDEYQFALKNISYTKIESADNLAEFELKITDAINTKLDGNDLKIAFSREIFFEPESMFRLKVAFEVILHLIEGNKEKATGMNWEKELVSNPNPYLGNVVSRISHLIADITASFGQQPLITPPNPMFEDETR